MLGMPGKSHRGPLPALTPNQTKLRAELERDVTALALEIGERNVHRAPRALDQAAELCEQELSKAGFEVERQTYDVEGHPCCNLIAELPGRGEEVVVVGAHYDSAPGTPGADDNATGTAALLALARRLTDQRARTLRFVAFTNEEPPWFRTEQMGSLVYARRCKERGDRVVAMLSLEMLGYYSDASGSQAYPFPFSLLYPSTGNFIGFIGNRSSRRLIRSMVREFRRSCAFPSEGASLPDLIPGVGFSDHWSFWQEGYRAVMVSDTAMFRNPNYHTPQDTLDTLDLDRCARVVAGLERVIAAQCA